MNPHTSKTGSCGAPQPFRGASYLGHPPEVGPDEASGMTAHTSKTGSCGAPPHFGGPDHLGHPPYFQASVTPGGAAAGYVQVGAATYPTVQGYAGPSTGGDFLYAPGFAVGGGYASNASGMQTFATIGYGVGARASGGPSGTVGTQMVTICHE